MSGILGFGGGGSADSIFMGARIFLTDKGSWYWDGGTSKSADFLVPQIGHRGQSHIEVDAPLQEVHRLRLCQGNKRLRRSLRIANKCQRWPESTLSIFCWGPHLPELQQWKNFIWCSVENVEDFSWNFLRTFSLEIEGRKSAKFFAKFSLHFSPVSCTNFTRTSLWGKTGLTFEHFWFYPAPVLGRIALCLWGCQAPAQYWIEILHP